MSKTKQRGKQFRDWWGKRPLSGHGVSNNSRINKFFKRLLHKIEREHGKQWVQNNLNE